MEKGEAVAYALNMLEERGVLFISPGDKLYEGMVIGENAKPQDLEVNPLKSKQLTNFRASGPKDESIRLTPPRRMTLEQAIAYIQDDELVEGHAQGDPHQEAVSRSARAQAGVKEGGGGLGPLVIPAEAGIHLLIPRPDHSTDPGSGPG